MLTIDQQGVCLRLTPFAGIDQPALEVINSKTG